MCLKAEAQPSKKFHCHTALMRLQLITLLQLQKRLAIWPVTMVCIMDTDQKIIATSSICTAKVEEKVLVPRLKGAFYWATIRYRVATSMRII